MVKKIIKQCKGFCPKCGDIGLLKEVVDFIGIIHFQHECIKCKCNFIEEFRAEYLGSFDYIKEEE